MAKIRKKAGRYLFRIQIAEKDVLNQQEISKSLRKKFAERNISLSENTIVEVVKNDEEWKINDNAVKWVIKKEKQTLHVYAERIKVIGEGDRIYNLTKTLGRGGQGVVYQVKGGELVVKILGKQDSPQQKALAQQIKWVQRLPIEDLPIAQPIEMLKPPLLGYVMDLASGMMALDELVNPTIQEDVSMWYMETGGLRQRLRLLAKISGVLNKLHYRALSYNDLSPSNIFISRDCAYSEVYFIDSDNIYSNSLEAPPLYTCGYGAPEIIQGKSFISTLTDTYSFAVMAFQLLSLVHPLMGDLVTEGKPEIEEEALAGKLPWVDHNEDKRNRSTKGIPRNMTLSPGLTKLFQRTFEEGLLNPEKRPSMAEWQERFYSALDYTIACPDCHSTFYANQKECPWCDTPRSTFVRISLGRWEPGEGWSKTIDQKGQRRDISLSKLALGFEEEFYITRRHAFGETGEKEENPLLRFHFTGKQITIEPLEKGEFYISLPNGRSCKKIHRTRTLSPGAKQILHFKRIDQPHRVLRFTLVS